MPRTAWVGTTSHVELASVSAAQLTGIIGIAQRARVTAAVGDGRALSSDPELAAFRAALRGSLGRVLALSEDCGSLLDGAIWAAPLFAEACSFAHELCLRVSLDLQKVRGVGDAETGQRSPTPPAVFPGRTVFSAPRSSALLGAHRDRLSADDRPPRRHSRCSAVDRPHVSPGSHPCRSARGRHGGGRSSVWPTAARASSRL